MKPSAGSEIRKRNYKRRERNERQNNANRKKQNAAERETQKKKNAQVMAAAAGKRKRCKENEPKRQARAQVRCVWKRGDETCEKQTRATCERTQKCKRKDMQ